MKMMPIELHNYFVMIELHHFELPTKQKYQKLLF